MPLIPAPKIPTINAARCFAGPITTELQRVCIGCAVVGEVWVADSVRKSHGSGVREGSGSGRAELAFRTVGDLAPRRQYHRVVDVAGATGGKPRSAPDLSSCIAYVTEYAWETIRDRHAAYRAGSEVGHNDRVSVLRTCHDCCPRVIDSYLKVS